MMRGGRIVDLIRGSRRFSLLATDSVPSLEPLNEAIFRTNETNPVSCNIRILKKFSNVILFLKANHCKDQDGRFYRIPEAIKKQLFTYGGLPNEYNTLSETLNELCIMVRKPTVELIDYLKKTNFDAPVPRYVLCKWILHPLWTTIQATNFCIDGNTGTGKSLSLAHILHYGSTAGFILVHVPWGEKGS